MRIRFIAHPNTPSHLVGTEHHIQRADKVIVAGCRVMSFGMVNPLCEDITEYKTVLDEDGNEIRVEIVPEEEVALVEVESEA